MRSGETLTKWEVTSCVLNLISCHRLSSYIRTFLGSGKICFMHSVWKVSRWVLTIEGELSRPVVGAGPGAAFSCWDPRPMGLGVWLGSAGQAKIEEKESGAQDCGIGVGPLLFPLSRSSSCPCVIAFNLEQTWLQNRTHTEIIDDM